MRRFEIRIPGHYITKELVNGIQVASSESELLYLLKVNGIRYSMREIYGKRNRERILHKRYNSRKR